MALSGALRERFEDYCKLAEEKASEGNVKEAINALEMAVSILLDLVGDLVSQAHTYANEARALAKAGRAEDALKLLDKAEEELEKNVDYIFTLVARAREAYAAIKAVVEGRVAELRGQLESVEAEKKSKYFEYIETARQMFLELKEKIAEMVSMARRRRCENILAAFGALTGRFYKNKFIKQLEKWDIDRIYTAIKRLEEKGPGKDRWGKDCGERPEFKEVYPKLLEIKKYIELAMEQQRIFDRDEQVRKLRNEIDSLMSAVARLDAMLNSIKARISDAYSAIGRARGEIEGIRELQQS